MIHNYFKINFKTIGFINYWRPLCRISIIWKSPSQNVSKRNQNRIDQFIENDIKRRRGIRKGTKSSTCLLFGAAEEERPRAPWKSSFVSSFILALKVTFYLGFVWDLQRPPASKGCACITALSSSGWISSNQITGWISFFHFMILLET